VLRNLVQKVTFLRGILLGLFLLFLDELGATEEMKAKSNQAGKRVPTLTGETTIAFPGFMNAERPMVEMGDCIPATPAVLESDSFYLCGARWQMLVYPFGNDEEGDVLSVRLKNLTEKPVELSYVLSLKRRVTDSVCIKFDTEKDAENPSSFMGNEPRLDVFQPLGQRDNEWGVEDLLLLEELYPLIVDGTLVVHCYMEVFSEVDLNSHPLTRLIETGGDAVTEADLLKLADADLVLLKKSQAGPSLGQISTKQDKIVLNRGLEPVGKRSN